MGEAQPERPSAKACVDVFNGIIGKTERDFS